MADQAILHVGFLGTRRTALVAADDSGMAFSHLATRGLGAVARTVKSTRILGRYPSITPTTTAARKSTSVLACAPLPLGNVDQPTDDMGLTALLTPYLLVIVSTTPVAQTHFKTPRSKVISAHSPMTGCLAWFPAVKVKSNRSDTDDGTSSTKLVYCWSNLLQILEVEAELNEHDGDSKRPSLIFQHQRQWKSEEAIVAVQWISRSVLAVLTITQRLIILDDYKLEMSDSADLNPRHIYHRDLFSRQLESLVSTPEQADESLHGVVPDAYSMSFKAYKGRLFLLDNSDVSMGTLSNWADRLVALMEVGRVVRAIELATSYYKGNTDKVTVGLPEDDALRKPLVGARVLQIIRASLDYTFRKDESDDLETDIRSALQDMVEPIFTACLCTENIDFLFEEVYERYSDASCQDMCLYAFEPRILSKDIRAVPAEILKDMVNWYASLDLGPRLEEMICALQTDSLDLDQVTALCKSYHLYDALIYVWNQAIGDYVTPLEDLLTLSRQFQPSQEHDDDQSQDYESAMKIFPYLAYSLTGRVYPSGYDMSSIAGDRAKTQLYGCLFAGKANQKHAKNQNYSQLRAILAFNSFEFMSMLNEAFEDSFLNHDSDQVINGFHNSDCNDSTSGWSINREHIIRVLREVLGAPAFSQEDRIYLDIFIARNLPKFPQYIRIPGVTMQAILTELCDPPQDGLTDECQLSVEYLLSMYRPPDMQTFIPLFEAAGFYRILKLSYKSSKQYPKWLQTHFDDPDDPSAVFDSIEECLRPGTALSSRQTKEVKALIIDHAEDLAEQSVERTAEVLSQRAPGLLPDVFQQFSRDDYTQFRYLKSLFNLQQDDERKPDTSSSFLSDQTERYVQLMCRYSPSDVSDFVNTTKAGDLRLDQVLPVMESTGVVDAAVVLLAKDGLVQEALERLIAHLSTLQAALTGLIENTEDEDLVDSPRKEQSLSELVDSVAKYITMGIWLCQGPGSANEQQWRVQRKLDLAEMTEDNLRLSEARWLDMVDAVVGVSRAVTTSVQQHCDQGAASSEAQPSAQGPYEQQLAHDADESLRKIVQDCFTALLAATTGASAASPSPKTDANSTLASANISKAGLPPRLLPIIHAFLTRLANTLPPSPQSPQDQSPASPAETLLPILSSIFSAHTFEHSLLHLATSLLDKDVFVSVADADARRRRGWRPQGRACNACGLRAWGVGTGAGVWDDWAAKREREGAGRHGRANDSPQAHGAHEDEVRRRAPDTGKARGKGKARILDPSNASLSGQTRTQAQDEGAEARGQGLVVFACGHLFHRGCLEAGLQSQGRSIDGQGQEGAVDGERDGRLAFVCLLCP